MAERGFPVGDSKIVDRAGPPEDEDEVVTATLENISESLFCKFPPLKKNKWKKLMNCF